MLIGWLLLWVLRVAMWLLIARAIMSWIPLLFPSFREVGLVAVVFGAIRKITDPPTRWMQRFIRPVGVGVISLDLSLMVWFVAVMLVQRMVVWVFF